MRHLIINRIISMILVFSNLFSSIDSSCLLRYHAVLNSNRRIIEERIMPEKVLTEKTISDETLTEEILTQHITTEVYLEELVIAEKTITELLLQEDTIEEVLSCQTIYVSEDMFDEFADNSQIASLFEEDFDIRSLLTKFSVGTGVIVTLVVLKRVHLPDPIAVMVCEAAEESIQFAVGGTVICSLFGGFTGAANEVDPSGRVSAIVGFATAVSGLILTAVSLITEWPSGGSTTITLVKGIKLILAGVSFLTTGIGTVTSGLQMINLLSEINIEDIERDSIDLDKVFISAAKEALQKAADGFMLGAVIGAVRGGALGYEEYHKYGAAYTTEKARINQVPTENSDKGYWTGERGKSDFVLYKPIKLEDGTVIEKVTYKNGIPDFSPYQVAQVKIEGMTDIRHGNANLGEGNFEKANEVLAKYWTKIKFNDRIWSGRDVEAFRKANNLTWHEMSNMKSMQLIPVDVNNTFTHCGGVAEYNAMIKGGAVEYD